MMYKRPITTMTLLVGLTAFALGRWSAPQEAPPPVAVTQAPPSPGSSAVPTKVDEPAPLPSEIPALQERLRELEQELRIEQARRSALDEELNGAPIPWPDDLPEPYLPEAYEVNLRHAIAECDAPLELLKIECDEPPCIAALRPSSPNWHGALIRDCPGWSDVYGMRVSTSTGNIDCGDGRREDFVLLSAVIPEWTDTMDKEEQGDLYRRMQHRWKQIEGDWDCGP